MPRLRNEQGQRALIAISQTEMKQATATRTFGPGKTSLWRWLGELRTTFSVETNKDLQTIDSTALLAAIRRELERQAAAWAPSCLGLRTPPAAVLGFRV